MRGLKEELKAVEKIKRVVNSTIDGARYKLKDATDTIQDVSSIFQSYLQLLLSFVVYKLVIFVLYNNF